ncbi:MAG: YHS domain-containing protein [Thiohalorhabdaceae bacterium]
MLTDPVCGMELTPRGAAAMALHQGRAYYFCSSACHEAFQSEPTRYAGRVPAAALTVGVMGSAGGDEPAAAARLVRDLGAAVAGRGLTLITGACPGLPLAAAQGAKAAAGLSVGISPGLSFDEHIHKYRSPADAFDVLIYTGSGLMGREVTNIRSSDMVVLAGGRSGTLGEFAIAYDEGKLIGILEGTGGVTDHIPELVAGFDKDTGARLFYEADPDALMRRLTAFYTDQHFHRPSCFCEDQAPGSG